MLHLAVFFHSLAAGMLPLSTVADMAHHFSSNFGNQIGGPIINDLGVVCLFYGGIQMALYAFGSAQTKPQHLKHALIAFILGAALIVGWNFISAMGNGVGQTLQNLIS